MLDLDHMRLRAHFEIAGFLPFRDLGDQRRPFGSRLAALKTEADLLASAPIVPLLRVNGHVARMHLLIVELFYACLEYLEIIVAGQASDTVSAGSPHFIFRRGVIRLEFGKREGP